MHSAVHIMDINGFTCRLGLKILEFSFTAEDFNPNEYSQEYLAAHYRADLCNSTPPLNPVESDKLWYHLLPDTLQGIIGYQAQRGKKSIAGNEMLPNGQEWSLYPHTHIALFLSDQRDKTRRHFQHVTRRKAPLQQICVSLLTQDPGHCKALHLHRSQQTGKKKPHILEQRAADDRSLYGNTAEL